MIFVKQGVKEVLVVFNSDESLLSKAVNTPYTQWMDIEYLIDETDDEVLKERLRRIMMEKYHTEEYYTGNL